MIVWFNLLIMQIWKTSLAVVVETQQVVVTIQNCLIDLSLKLTVSILYFSIEICIIDDSAINK
jgi:hypothetical protein